MCNMFKVWIFWLPEVKDSGMQCGFQSIPMTAMSSILDQWLSEKSTRHVTSSVDSHCHFIFESHCYFIYAHWALQMILCGFEAADFSISRFYKANLRYCDNPCMAICTCLVKVNVHCSLNSGNICSLIKMTFYLNPDLLQCCWKSHVIQNLKSVKK